MESQLHAAALRTHYNWAAVHAEMSLINPRLYSSPDACRLLFSASVASSASSGAVGDDGLDLDALLGKQCSILVLQAKSKTGAVYSNVERVFPA